MKFKNIRKIIFIMGIFILMASIILSVFVLMPPETTEIITMDGKCYQSYVASNVDIRYIWVSKEEHEMSATWNWVPVGTQKFYSLLLLGRVNEGRK